MALHKKEKTLSLELGDKDSLSRSYDNLRQDCGVTVLQTGLHLPGARIVDRAGDGANARDALAVDELADRARHGVFLSQCVDANPQVLSGPDLSTVRQIAIKRHNWIRSTSLSVMSSNWTENRVKQER
jgi:hypothetical protein